MVTTNFDFLLEQAFEELRKRCHPVVDEGQFGISNPYPGPVVYKMHGDMHRPDRLVLTEEDYDRYLLANPLYSTVIASLFAQRSAVLIGYSLSDPDLRQVLALVRERLGRGARLIHAVMVGASTAAIQRFHRRGVKVISLPGDRSNPAPVLERLFDEIFARIPTEARRTLIPRDYSSALALQRSTVGRTCFLSAPLANQPDYFEWLVPAAERFGVSIVRLEDFVVPGASLFATLEAVVATASCAIVDVESQWTEAELATVLSRLGRQRVLVVSSGQRPMPSDMQGVPTLNRPQAEEGWPSFSDRLLDWLVQTLDVGGSTGNRIRDDLLGAIMRLASQLELALGDRFGEPPTRRTLGRLVQEAQQRELIDIEESRALRSFVVLRNEVAHGKPPSLGADHVGLLLSEVHRILDRLRAG